MFGNPWDIDLPEVSGNSWWDTVIDWVDGFTSFWDALTGDDRNGDYRTGNGYPAGMPFDWQAMIPMILLGGGLLLAITILRK